MYRFQRAIMLILLILILTGCGDQRILERLGFTHTTSYDLAPDDEQSSNKEEQPTKSKLLISNLIPRPDSDGGSSGANSNTILTAIANTSKEGKVKLSRQTELMLVSGQLRNTLFGSSLARQGIWEHIDTLVRDTSISPRLKITVVSGSAHELLAKEYPQHQRTGQYLDQMLEKEAAAQAIPQVSLYQFTKDYLDDGIDPVAPIIKDAGKHIVLDGIALFQDDRYVTRIQPDEALIFTFLRGKFKNGEISVDLSEVGRTDEHIMFSSLVSGRSIKINSNTEGNQYRADIYIKVKGSVLEYTGILNLDNEEHQRIIEKHIAQFIKIKAEAMVAMMQKHQVDSIGLGKYVRNSLSYEKWRNMDWKNVYQNLEVNCHVSIRVKDYGKFVNVDL